MGLVLEITKVWKSLKENISNRRKKHDDYTDDEPKPNWQQLPIDMWHIVFEHLDLLDAIIFSCVCKEFRSISTHRPRLSNVLLLIHNQRTANREFELLSFKDSNRYKIPLPKTLEHSRIFRGSSFGYLIFQRDRYNDFILWNPLSKIQISLPSIYEYVNKVTLSSKPSKKGNNNNVFAICSCYSNDIHICRIGDQNWTKVAHSSKKIADILYDKNRVFVIGYEDCAFYIDLNSNKKLVKCGSLCLGWKKSYFAISSKGEVVLIQRKRMSNGSFEIFMGKLDEKRNKWKSMSRCKDYVFLDTSFDSCEGDTICLSKGKWKPKELMSQPHSFNFVNKPSFGQFKYNNKEDVFKIIFLERPKLCDSSYWWLAPNPC